MYLLDTNVLSEMRRQRPHGAVVAWLAATQDWELHVAAVTIGELQAGIERVRGHNQGRAQEIEAWLDLVAMTFNVVPMEARTFRIWARLMNGRQHSLTADAMIAATAIVHNMVVVTRNVRDFVPLGVEALNPFGPVV